MTRFIQLIAAFAVSIALAVAALPANAQKPPPSTVAAKAQIQRGGEQQHRLVIQVDTNDAAAMNLALNNAANVDQYYSDRGELVEIEAHRSNILCNLFRIFLEHHEHSRLAEPRRAAHDELHREHCLPRARTSRYERRAPQGQSAVSDFIQAHNPRASLGEWR